MHFYAMVVVKHNDSVEGEIERLLAPTSEHLPDNDNGKWDWYQIGGRWTGALTGYDPATDEKNIEVCDLCQGTGKRTDPVGMHARSQDPNYTCNGCQGKGKRTKWPTEWVKYTGDVQPIEKVIAGLEAGAIHEPHDVVGPDGNWYNPGARVENDIKMANSMEENYKKEGKFDTLDFMAKYIKEQKEQHNDGKVSTLLKKWPGHFVVVVDFHS